MEAYNEETMTKAIRFPVELIKQIEALAKENQRDFSKQVRFMCEQYLRLREGMK